MPSKRSLVTFALLVISLQSGTALRCYNCTAPLDDSAVCFRNGLNDDMRIECMPSQTFCRTEINGANNCNYVGPVFVNLRGPIPTGVLERALEINKGVGTGMMIPCIHVFLFTIVFSSFFMP